MHFESFAYTVYYVRQKQIASACPIIVDTLGAKRAKPEAFIENGQTPGEGFRHC